MKQSVKLVAGNWKMNGLGASLAEAETLEKALKEQAAACRVALCPPATLIDRMAQALKGGAVEIGGQDCHAETSGAYTGSVSAEMVRDAGARLVILGHSERRAGFGETDADVAAKVEAALAADLEPIICIGETLQEREAGQAVEVVSRQVAGSLPASLAGKAFAVAYEPVWAIGTGLTPTLEQIEEVHAAVRAAMVAKLGDGGRVAPILYGGSVKPSNAREILAVAEVGGALVGGASLKAEDFLGIIRAV
ncbi:Triosephosphate isomerase [Brevundimonas diminuta]|jgi:triosephosphate isomerase|uniref:Triosephosphate isomerase n=2 Tax=Brevundimonas TaxID=41275 RepID=A0A246KDY7_BREDI|nr:MULTISPECIES: triose-phosphate isomerase [Brevundimonas]EGF94242.1 triose-phosphate isomerase [Brevundimonas diminuta ATCC 11568]MBD3572219.1 triose-phosphate isomerase [Brevundimonas diminuta]MBD3818193.1 triose-phosphate isomerase [Brevundimonas diminuta]OMG59959.1 triose-phosphate isomerase [Brevundimonas sp. ZS04]OWR20894.1 triose-phosphate isomerase [Brevundimonas diminuta]